jgi:hypothetical protein
MMIAASGAASYASEELSRIANEYGLTNKKESPSAPWLPAIVDGGFLMIEQVMCAYMQEALWHASSICGGIESKKRITRKALMLACEATDRNMFSFGSFAMDPKRVYMCDESADSESR